MDEFLGKQFNKLTIIEKLPPKIKPRSSGNRKQKVRLVLCRCNCGNTRVCRFDDVTSSRVKSCKKCSGYCLMPEDFISKKFGKLKVLESKENIRNHQRVLCQCDCGEERIVTLTDLNCDKVSACMTCTKYKYAYLPSYYIGKTINNFIILEEVHAKDRIGHNATVLCKCVCGNSDARKVKLSDIITGKKKGCRKCPKKYQRKYDDFENIPGIYYRRSESGAIKRELDFFITIEYLNTLWIKQNERCALSNVKISFSNRTASLDRIDSSIGYIEGNVQWVHKDINRMKQNFSQKNFINYCKLIIANKENQE